VERSGTAPPSPGGNPARTPLHILRGLVVQKTSIGFFLETPIPYTSEASKKEKVKKNLWKARLAIRQFSPFNFVFSTE
jgi:hypothetical protein